MPSPIENGLGYAVRRNNTCRYSEQHCGKGSTWGDFQACCPENTVCFDSNTGIRNMICCEDGNNCTEQVSRYNSCADKSWNLFDRAGSFCCDQEQTGFYVESSFLVGCAPLSFPGNDSFVSLPTLSYAEAFVSPTATPSSSPVSSSTSSSTPKATSNSSSGSSSTNVGAIAGGVVGGVAGIAIIAAILFFFIRRRKQQDTQFLAETHHHQPSEPYSPPVYSEAGDGQPPKELDGQPKSELDGQPRSELDDSPLREPQELPASQ